jgi:hypothetical protein
MTNDDRLQSYSTLLVGELRRLDQRLPGTIPVLHRASWTLGYDYHAGGPVVPTPMPLSVQDAASPAPRVACQLTCFV